MVEVIINGDVHIHGLSDDAVIKNGKSVHKLRNSNSVISAKKRVKSRDGNCQCCGTNDSLEVHHILPISKYKDLASDEGNMVSLCSNCHSRYHELYPDDVNAVTFAKYLKDFGNRFYGG